MNYLDVQSLATTILLAVSILQIIYSFIKYCTVGDDKYIFTSCAALCMSFILTINLVVLTRNTCVGTICSIVYIGILTVFIWIESYLQVERKVTDFSLTRHKITVSVSTSIFLFVGIFFFAKLTRTEDVIPPSCTFYGIQSILFKAGDFLSLGNRVFSPLFFLVLSQALVALIKIPYTLKSSNKLRFDSASVLLSIIGIIIEAVMMMKMTRHFFVSHPVFTTVILLTFYSIVSLYISALLYYRSFAHEQCVMSLKLWSSSKLSEDKKNMLLSIISKRVLGNEISKFKVTLLAYLHVKSKSKREEILKEIDKL